MEINSNSKMIKSVQELFFLAQNNYKRNFGALIAVGITIFLWNKFRRKRSAESAIPGRLGFPFIGETFLFLASTKSFKGCYDFVRLRRLWYGKWFKTRIFGKIHVFVPSIHGAKTILTNDFVMFNKGYIKSMADVVGKRSLLCLPKESHNRIRHLLSYPFSMNSQSKFVQKFDQMLCARLKKLERDGNSFRVLTFNMKITIDAMCDMLMSVTDASLLQEIEKDCAAVSDAMLSIPIMIPGTRYYKGIKARGRLIKLFERMIASRRSGAESPEDLLQFMLERNSNPSDEKLDDAEVMDNLLTMIIAGQSTTAAALMWAVKHLDENKEIQQKLRDEQLAILKRKPREYLLTLEDINNMSYASKVVKETLRMANVLLWFPRVALDDCTIEGIEIKKGWHVNVDATCIHYDPEQYKDPMQFNPSRFDVITKPYSYIPFGSGPRRCIGINMAKVTMMVYLHRLTSRYTWRCDDLDLSLEANSHVPRLKSGCPITLIALPNDEDRHTP